MITFAVAVAGRYKISEQTSVLFNYDQPLTKHKDNNPQFNVSTGIEVATSSHQFQIFVTNYPYLVPQKNNMYNQPNTLMSGIRIYLSDLTLQGSGTFKTLNAYEQSIQKKNFVVGLKPGSACRLL
jgi:hypothetical protein